MGGLASRGKDMMTKQEAIENQTKIAEHYNLGWWYGTNCQKCHDVYPKLMTTGNGDCYYQCEVCGKRSGSHSMPWLARDDWNSMAVTGQMSIFDFMED